MSDDQDVETMNAIAGPCQPIGCDNGYHLPGCGYATCECGDYRLQHQDGTGRCQMPDDMTHGFKPCNEFRPVATTARPGGDT
jgi:hypothetical protein